MNCYVCIQTHAYVSQVFLWSLQESFCKFIKNHFHPNQSPKILVLPFQHLLFVFHLVGFHPLHYQQRRCFPDAS